MSTNSDEPTEVLHNENHAKLSSEEVAKAVARHNKNHSADKAGNQAAKAKNAEAHAPSGEAKAKKGPKV